MSDRLVPRAFLPGEFIQDSLNARGWKQADLASILGVSAPIVSDLVKGKRRITYEIARALADAFGNEPEEWIKLQATYDATIKAARSDEVRVRKGRLWSRVPVRLMTDRGWLTPTENIDTLEAQAMEFYRKKTVEDIKPEACAARKSTDNGELTNEQLAWFMRAKNLAECLPLKRKYNPRSFRKLLDELEPLRVEPEEARKVPATLERYGIRFLIIEHLPSSKIDGICFWVGENQDKPVIVLSMRYDRIDWFWFTLMHELAHVYYGHGKKRISLDMSLVGADAQPHSEKVDEEKKADAFASEYLVGERDLDEFVGRLYPLFSDTNIKGFADRIGVHPGIVIGRLQHMGRISYSRGRGMLAKIRHCVVATAITDGWKNSVEFGHIDKETE
ncbi:MAG TPA: HigA family addiction module antitoxin [candidate division Zixibacteria bacterium]|nr:HigA family addiction module antitoxin [candidate division Zixibacteria bacterium]